MLLCLRRVFQQEFCVSSTQRGDVQHQKSLWPPSQGNTVLSVQWVRTTKYSCIV